MSVCRSYLLFIALMVTSHVGAQISLTANADARQIVAGQYFTVTFTLENARGSNFQPPSFIDFDVVGGPNTSTQMTIINGRRQQKMSYSYSLTSSKIGKYKIGPASISTGGKKYTSNSIEIEVVKGRAVAKGQANATGSAEFLVEAIVDHATGYVGQQITLKYVLLTNQDVRSYNFNALPKFEGFFAQEIQNYQSRPEQVVRDGVQYYSRVLKVIALFPQQRGQFTLDPAQMTLGVSDGRRSNSFFFNTRLKQHRATSTTIDIHVIETPQGAPLSFSGAIGDFYMGSAVDKKSITMDDALTLTLQVRGFGDGKFVEAPDQPYTDLFDIYDPNLLQEKSEVVSDRIQVTKTYEYLMIPKKIGVIKFNPEFTFYNIDSSKYETVYGQQYRVNVVKGSDRELADLQKEDVVLAPPPPIGKLYQKGKEFAFSWGHIGTNGFIALSILGLVLVRRIKDQKDNIDPALKRKLKAKKLAVKKLSMAKVALDQGDIKDFYIKLRQALQDYLSDKTNQQTSQLSKDDITNLLGLYDLEEYLDPILSMMQKGEQAIYASIAPGKEAEDYDRALTLISQIESSLD